MTTKRETSTPTRSKRAGKLKLNRDTLKNLDTKGKARDVKGGGIATGPRPCTGQLTGC